MDSISCLFNGTKSSETQECISIFGSNDWFIETKILQCWSVIGIIKKEIILAASLYYKKVYKLIGLVCNEHFSFQVKLT